LGPPSTHLHLLKICSKRGKTKCTKENIPKRQIQGSSTLRLIEIYQFDQKDIRVEIAETNWWLKMIVNWDICEELKDSTAKPMSLLSRHIGKSHCIECSVYRSCTVYRYNGPVGPHGVGP